MVKFLFCFGILCVIALVYSIISIKMLKVTRYDYSSERVPNALHGKKAVLISDLHCCHHGKKNKRLLNKIHECNPDLIFITGDLINGVKPDETDYTEEFMASLQQFKCPVYFCPGNHDQKLVKRDKEAYKKNLEIIKKYSRLMINSTIYLPEEKYYISGIQIPLVFYHKKCRDYRLERLIDAAYETSYEENPDEFRILLAHDPFYFERYAASGADLILCGHMHGGIARLPFIGGIISPRFTFFPKYDKGRFDSGRSTMYISGGLGWHNLPIRFLNTPELVVINLTKK